MTKSFLGAGIFWALACLKCFAQNGNVWDYNERLFVEKKQNMYILECFHHKVEMLTDTLIFENNSTYIGQRYTLTIRNKQLYLKSNNFGKELKLKATRDEALKNRENRKEYFIQFQK